VPEFGSSHSDRPALDELVRTDLLLDAMREFDESQRDSEEGPQDDAGENADQDKVEKESL